MSASPEVVEQAIRQSLGVIRPAAATLDGGADLASAAGLDSAEIMDLVMAIEDRLDVSIPVDTLSRAHTIDELRAGILSLGGGGR